MEKKNIIKTLLEGNQHYITGGALHPNQSFEHRLELAESEKPIAAILTCADSRVSPEIIFDQGSVTCLFCEWLAMWSTKCL